MGQLTSKTIALIRQNQTDQPHIVRLEPGTTLAQALQQAGISTANTVTHPDGVATLALDDDLFAICEDGDKLKVTPEFTAGAWWNPLEWFAWERPMSKSTLAELRSLQAQTYAPAPPASAAVPLPAIIASTPTDERWLQRYGWQRQGNAWRGYFRIPKRPPLKAYIDLGSTVPKAYFENPPEPVRTHHCVHPHANAANWYWVNERAAISGRTLRGFVTSVEAWIHQQLRTRPPAAAVAEPQQANVPAGLVRK
ncbi:MAG: hypothetical protein U1F36_22535 [Planctomycetota bacterium]